MLKRKTSNGIKPFVTIFLTVLLVGVIITNVMTIGFAALDKNAIDGLILTTTNGDWNLVGNNNITGNIKSGKSSNSCTGTSYPAKTATLTIKNNKGDSASFSFDYELTLNGGSSNVAGNNVATNGNYSGQLAANATCTVSITSASTESGYSTGTTIVLKNITIIVEKNVTGKFYTASNGTYTVNGSAVTDGMTKTQSASNDFTLVASPSPGYELFGWHISSTISDASALLDVNVSSTSSSYSFKKDSDFYVRPEFITSGTALFTVNGVYYKSLSVANNAASTGSNKTIILATSGTLYENNVTISAGNVLLIPMDSVGTVVKSTPSVSATKRVATSAFRTLTIDNNVSLTISGELSLAGKLIAYGQSMGEETGNGVPSGPSGRIILRDGSSIILDDKSETNKGLRTLYCWGFISGAGTVVAESGSTVWEPFQLGDWRGGTEASGMRGNSQRVFPMSQYYIQNIESSLVLKYGSTENVYTAINVRGSVFDGTPVACPASTVFIGDTGLFRLSSGAKITKYYDSITDRLHFELEGSATFGQLSLTLNELPLIGTLNFNTADYTMPLNSNLEIVVKSGTTTIDQDVCMLPESSLTINFGAKAVINAGRKIYVYDVNEWGNYCYNGGAARLSPIYYISSGVTTVRTDITDDAKINVNGSLTNNGHLYTTNSGANIYTSEGLGKIIYNNAQNDATTTTYQYNQGTGNYVGITCFSAILQNGSKATSEDNKYYSDQKWHTPTATAPTEGGTHTYTFQNPNTSHASDANKLDYYWWSSSDVIPNITITYKVGSSTKNVEYNMNGSSNFTFDNDSTVSSWISNANDKKSTIYKWKKDDGVYFNAYDNTIDAAAFKANFSVDTTLTPFYGGWYRTSSVVGDAATFAYMNDGGENVIGLYEMPLDYDKYIDFGDKPPSYVNVGTICYFDTDGNFSKSCTKIFKYDATEYANGDNQIYYVKEGIMQEDAGLINIGTSENPRYYYIGTDNHAYAGGRYYISKVNDTGVVPGYYYFGENGLMNNTSAPTILENDHVYYSYTDENENEPAYGYGIVYVNGNYYYVQEDASIAKNTTVCITCSNGVNGIKVGKWYSFDEDGKIINFTPVTPSRISNDGIAYFGDGTIADDYGLFALGGYLYYADASGAVIKNVSFYVTKTNGCVIGSDSVEEGLYYFDSNGHMYSSSTFSVITTGGNGQ